MKLFKSCFDFTMLLANLRILDTPKHVVDCYTSIYNVLVYCIPIHLIFYLFISTFTM